jgi:electron transfer flavoprotein alpha/beta subunit
MKVLAAVKPVPHYKVRAGIKTEGSRVKLANVKMAMNRIDAAPELIRAMQGN